MTVAGGAGGDGLGTDEDGNGADGGNGGAGVDGDVGENEGKIGGGEGGEGSPEGKEPGQKGQDGPDIKKASLIGSAALADVEDPVKVIAIAMTEDESCVELVVRMTLKDGVDFATWASETQKKGLFQVKAGETLATLSEAESAVATVVGTDAAAGTVTLRMEKPVRSDGFFRAVVGKDE